jgi:glycine cleavage system H protein
VAQPADLLYTKEHEWARVAGDVATVGITDYAQNALGDIVYVELPKAGTGIEQSAAIGVVESVKAVSDLFTPVAGEIMEVNAALEADPALVNREPYGAGWLIKVKLRGDGGVGNLLAPDAYEKLVAGPSTGSG